METFPEDPFETVKARIVGGDERQVVGVLRGGRRGTKNFASVSCILLLRKATVIWPKYSFSFCFSSICLSDAHSRAGRRSHQS